MKKIISLFQRNYDTDRLIRDQVVPGAEWVLNGEGVATRKYDGTCCMVRDGKLYKRYDVKKKRTPPEDFEPAQEPDPITGHWPGWVPVKDIPDDIYHREAFERLKDVYIDGTYELCGPKIQGNPEGFDRHYLIMHGIDLLLDAPRTFEELREYLKDEAIEGIVWHHPDGRRVKIKGKDFGYKRAENKD